MNTQGNTAGGMEIKNVFIMNVPALGSHDYTDNGKGSQQGTKVIQKGTKGSQKGTKKGHNKW